MAAHVSYTGTCYIYFLFGVALGSTGNSIIANLLGAGELKLALNSIKIVLSAGILVAIILIILGTLLKSSFLLIVKEEE